MSKLYVVATPIGNLKDMTERAIEVLNSSDVILCEDTRSSLNLLNHFDIHKKLVSYHKFNEDFRSNEIIDKMLEEDLTISIITDAGTPCISDPGAYIVRKARENGIDVFAVPGASAVISSISVSGFDFYEFAFLGFFPRENKEQKSFIEKIDNLPIDTFVIYEAPKRLKNTLKMLQEYDSELKVICCNDITKLHEKYTYGIIGDVIEEIEANPNSELGEYVICVQKKIKEKQKEDISYEAIIVDDIVKNGGTIKDSISRLKNTYKKNELYSAGLNLKELFKE